MEPNVWHPYPAISRSKGDQQIIDALVAAMETARNDLRGHGFNVDDLDAALALARGEG